MSVGSSRHIIALSPPHPLIPPSEPAFKSWRSACPPVALTRPLQSHAHLVTASYADDAMHTLQQQAADAGVTLLCEMGLDPGIGEMGWDGMGWDGME